MSFLKKLAGQLKTSRFALTIGALGVIVGVAGVAAIGLGGFGYQWGWWHYSTGFRMLALGALLGLSASLLALAALGYWWFRRRQLLLAVGAVGLMLGLPAFILPVQTLQQAQRLPRINDISTDTEHPPPFVAVVPLRAGAPNRAAYAGAEVAAQQRAAYPDLGPMRFAGPPGPVYDAALAAAREMGWEIVASHPGEGRVEATAVTFLFGFKDDVVVRVRPDGVGTRLDIRSKSRVGRSDIGTNARRIRRYLNILQEAGLQPLP